LNFLTTTTYPHLPFEDNYFNMIYAGSVFTHIGDLEDAWLMELKRILRPNGRLYLTVHDTNTINLLLSAPSGHWLHDTNIRKQLIDFEQKTSFTSTGFGMIIFAGDPGNTQIFHDTEFLKRRWGQILKVLSVTPEAYGYQTAITLTKCSISEIR
jgi:SAM-dependent methyltransferase